MKPLWILVSVWSAGIVLSAGFLLFGPGRIASDLDLTLAEPKKNVEIFPAWYSVLLWILAVLLILGAPLGGMFFFSDILVYVQKFLFHRT